VLIQRSPSFAPTVPQNLQSRRHSLPGKKPFSPKLYKLMLVIFPVLIFPISGLKHLPYPNKKSTPRPLNATFRNNKLFLFLLFRILTCSPSPFPPISRCSFILDISPGLSVDLLPFPLFLSAAFSISVEVNSFEVYGSPFFSI